MVDWVGSWPIARWWYPLTVAQRANHQQSFRTTDSERNSQACAGHSLLSISDPVSLDCQTRLERCTCAEPSWCCNQEKRTHIPIFLGSKSWSQGRSAFRRAFCFKVYLIVSFNLFFTLGHRKRFYFIYILIACSPLGTKLLLAMHKNSFHLTFFSLFSIDSFLLLGLTDRTSRMIICLFYLKFQKKKNPIVFSRMTPGRWTAFDSWDPPKGSGIHGHAEKVALFCILLVGERVVKWTNALKLSSYFWYKLRNLYSSIAQNQKQGCYL